MIERFVQVGEHDADILRFVTCFRPALGKMDQLGNSSIFGLKTKLIRAEPWVKKARKLVDNMLEGFADNGEKRSWSVVAWCRTTAFLVDRNHEGIFQVAF